MLKTNILLALYLKLKLCIKKTIDGHMIIFNIDKNVLFQFDSFIPCSERIVRAVTDMVLLFPEESGHSSISASLSSLTAAATHFESECRMLILRSQKETLNQNFVTQQVIQCAFDIAKATKQLVALFQ